jgi:hypothetical protein
MAQSRSVSCGGTRVSRWLLCHLFAFTARRSHEEEGQGHKGTKQKPDSHCVSPTSVRRGFPSVPCARAASMACQTRDAEKGSEVIRTPTAS